MALIVTIANEKGGVSKTTTAVEFALQALAEGYKVMLIDTDPQQGAAKFRARRRQLSPELIDLRVTPITGKTVGTQIQDFAQDVDILVVDSGGRDSQEMRLAMLTSHIVVIPTSAKAAETDGLNKMAMLVNECSLQNRSIKPLLLLTRLGATSWTSDRDAVLAELGKPIVDSRPDELISGVLPTVLKAHTVWRNAFDNAYQWGRSVREMKPRDPKATSEVLNCFGEILRHG
jgi:chromosome partitioning protein